MAKTWLLKTEPSSYSFDALLKDGKTVWDGVSNPVALKHLRSMKKGDELFIYHTGNEKAVVGTARVVSAPYPDPKTNDPRLVVVEISAGKKLARPVTLHEIKADRIFAGFELARIPRLSVMPVPEVLKKRILLKTE
jgi:predicted RNA-binding protein with PUA-like domain